MKIALVHGFLKEYGGAERVLEALHEIYPEAPVYTSFVDFERLGPHAQRIKKWDIRESWVGKSWLIKKLHSPLRFLAPLIWESFNLDEFDVVISSSGWYICRGVITRPETLHICYLHHPPRHLYGYQTSFDWQKHLPIRVYGHLVNHYLRIYDFLAAQRVDYFIANSKETQRRIAKFYRRESEVIYPPVGMAEVAYENFCVPLLARDKTLPVHNVSGAVSEANSKNFVGSPPSTRAYFLCVSRLARAKNIHLAIEACNRLNLSLKIIGKGREKQELEALGSRLKARNIEFLGELSDEELSKIYAGAKALIFPAQDEEFGIVPLEAMAYGIPVIAFRSGGVKETIVEGKTGLFFDKLTVESLIKAIKQYNNITINPKDCFNQAEKFSKKRFEREIKTFVNQKLQFHYTET